MLALVFVIEHLGTREILPVKNESGGNTLEFTNEGEVMAWFAGPSKPLVQTNIDVIKKRGLDKIAVLRGQDIPSPRRAASFCSFGESVIDFTRMRNQLLGIGDSIQMLGKFSTEEIAGDYLDERKLRAEG